MKPQLLLLPLIWLLLACELPFVHPNEPFFCKINGKAFRPEKDSGWLGSPSLYSSWDKEDGILYIRAFRGSETISLILIFKDKILKDNTFELLSDTLSSKGSYSFGNNAGQKLFHLSVDGQAKIEKNTGTQLSGSFEFTGKNTITGKEYKITKGVFNDLHYYNK